MLRVHTPYTRVHEPAAPEVLVPLPLQFHARARWGLRWAVVTCWSSVVLGVCICMSWSAAWPCLGAAQDKPDRAKAAAHTRVKHAASNSARVAKRKAKKSAPMPAASAAPAPPATATATATATAADGGSVPPQPSAALEAPGVDVRKEGDTEVKTMEFSGLDIEGQLKSPQMLYFLKRLRAEFEHPRLPHRSFMPELARSTKESDF